MKYNTILSDFSDGVTTITINRPTKLNALNSATIEELHEAITAAESDFDTKVIIITGSGEKAFVAGADISEFANYDENQAYELSKKGQHLLFDLIENLSTPVIAAVNGFALGGGLELAMAAHFRLASTNARMGLPEVSLGLIPGYGGTQRLTQLVGKGRAMELIMTASMIDAEKALTYGLVNYVVPQEELLPRCFALADQIKSNSSLAISAAIKAVNANFADGVNGYNVEISEFAKCFGTGDFEEGTTAFLEKRKAQFPGK
jgi:enoyl-CoA hydratase|tara:strand:+ start:255 stop:1037 length:783 start_codon:yes stop_codon:yes gene_type:complete